MKTKEELNTLKNEVETLNKKLAELTEDELQQVAGGESDSGELSSKQVFNVMFGYITNRDELHAVRMYCSKGFLLSVGDNEVIHYMFKQIFGHEIEESPYNI